MELKITTEKVQAGAAKCPQAAGVLKEMFPEAFKDITITLNPQQLRALRIVLANVGGESLYSQRRFVDEIATKVGGPELGSNSTTGGIHFKSGHF